MMTLMMMTVMMTVMINNRKKKIMMMMRRRMQSLDLEPLSLTVSINIIIFENKKENKCLRLLP